MSGYPLRTCRMPAPDSTPRSAPTATSTKPWWARALVWLVGVGLMAWLLWHVPFETVKQALAKPTPGVWLSTLSGLVISYLLRAARLQVVMGLAPDTGARHWLGLRLDALRVILMHNAAVNLLPMRAGELSFPYLASRLLHMPLNRAVASLMWMRLQDLAVLLSLGLLCWPTLPWAWRLAGLATIVLGWQAGIRLLDWLYQRLQTRETGAGTPHTRAKPAWQQLLGRFHEALLEPHHHHWSTWAFTWANWGTKLLAGAWLMSHICDADLAQAWSGALGGELAAVVPLQGPAGFGTYEAGVWAGLHLSSAPTGLGASGIHMNLAVPAALALHLCFLLCAVLAGAGAWIIQSASSAGLPGVRQNTRIPD
jgi:hypothetical protein